MEGEFPVDIRDVLSKLTLGTAKNLVSELLKEAALTGWVEVTDEQILEWLDYQRLLPAEKVIEYRAGVPLEVRKIKLKMKE